MPALALCAFAFEQLFQWRYGAAGALAFGMFTVGHKARNTTVTCVGLVVIALLLTR
ncbi:hypothetical protein ACFWVC_27515 [Streptomyces sp. NPDC058691]|uniref:hypothetical protein n=1 Tax=Streptomyces sp. NPDC058691 TaxID=3346601 RepID=UPI00364E1D2E